MSFKIKDTKQKDPAIYKTLYIKQALADKIEKIAEIQRNNIKDNIVFYTEKIKQLKHLLEEMRSDVDG